MSFFLHGRLLSQTAQHLSVLHRVRGMASRAADLYEVLGVERTCPQGHIKVAFYRQAKKMHPDIQRDEEVDRQAEQFIRLAAAYEVLRDPTRRATYDAHLSSRSKFVRSAFAFDPPSSAETDWPEDPIGNQQVAPWVRQYRQAVREVVKYGGEGEGLAHLVKMEFGAAVRKAYFGPEVGELALGEWPMEFEGEERSMAGLGDVMHLVSGRQLLGTVREARDILLGHDVYGRPTAALEAAEADEGTERIGAIYEPGFSESGLGDGEESSRLRAGLAGDFGTRVEADDGGRARQNRSENEEGKSFGRSVPSGSGEAAQDAGSSESEQASSEDARSRDGPNASGQDVQSADDRPRSSAQTSGTESQTDGETGWRSGERSNYISSEKAVDGREESGDDFFATLELTQHEEVVGVATREWVPLAENGSRSGTATREEAGEDPERIDCISIYAVNRGESVNEQNGEEAKSGCGGLDWENTEQSGSKRGTEKGTEDRDAPESSSGRATQSGTESASRQGNNSQTGLENENRHNRAAHGNHDEKRSGSGSGHRNGNGNGNGVDGWAGDIEKLGMRYRQPQLLARIFGLRDGRPSTDVFREGVEKTHTLLQHRTPLVRHMAWYRSDVDKRGRRIRKCEARLRRAAMLPSSLWLFEPRASTHDCGGWYFERFDDEETRAAPPFARLAPHASFGGRGLLEDKRGTDSGSARNRHRLAEREHFGAAERGWGSSRTGNRHQHSRHGLRFDWPSEKSKESTGDEDSHPRMTAQAKRDTSAIVTPLDPAVYILTAAFLTLDKEQEARTAKPSAVADLLQKGVKWTGDIRHWWQTKVGA